MNTGMSTPATASPLRAVVRLDLRLQWRYGFFYATAFSIVLWEVIVALIPGQLKLAAMPYVVFGDSVLIGFFFIAGAVFFEKGERTLFALLSTPVRFRHYLTGKLATLSLLSLVAAGVVSGTGAGPDIGTAGNAATLFVAVVLCTLLFLLSGLITAAPFPSMTDWLMPSTLVIAALNVPLLAYAGIWEHPAFYLLPTQGSLLLLGSAFGQRELEAWQVAYALGYQLLWIAGLCLLARKVFDRYIVAREGAE
ncbi:ABC transporter permease family protein [Flindersiella endophytica]